MEFLKWSFKEWVPKRESLRVSLRLEWFRLQFCWTGTVAMWNFPRGTTSLIFEVFRLQFCWTGTVAMWNVPRGTTSTFVEYLR